MEGERLHTISVSVCPDSYLIIPVRIDTDDEIGGCAPWTRQRGSLTPAQSDVLYRHAAAFRDVAEQIRALARGEFTSADLGGDDAAAPLPPDKNVRIAHRRDVRCTGGRVYWW
jgi:hypothetical protein